MEILLVIIILVLAIILLIFQTAKYKGKIGEEKVSLVLHLLSKEYVVLNNVYIPFGNHTKQIDHIVVSPYGIFVIETKNYKGWIYGGEDKQYWTQNIYGHKFQLYNPILQNQSHIKALKNILPPSSNNAFVSIIAFSNKARLFIKSEHAEIVHIWKVALIIKKYNVVVLNDDEINQIIIAITNNKVEGKGVISAHKQSVRDVKSAYKDSISNGRCPRCGGILIKRHGKYGTFFGCSNYPQCHFTH